MFKENREFWLYYVGVIILFFLVFAVLKGGFSNDASLMFSFWPFNYLSNEARLFPESQYRIDENKDYSAIIKTSRGQITIDLYGKNAPNTVSNFIYLANNSFYNELKFHRYIKDFLLQGGSPNTLNSDPNDDKFGGPGYTIPDEINWDSLDFSSALKAELSAQGYTSVANLKSKDIGIYDVVMATNGPNTGGSQFAIILADASDPRVQKMRGKFTVFGHVTGGFALMDEINTLGLENLFIKTVSIQVKE